MKNILDIADRVIVVVGATSGLGEAIALGLAAHGARVVATGRRADRVDQVASAIEGLGSETVRLTVDVTGRASIDAMRDSVLERFGRIDVLVNAAGITHKEPTAVISEESWNAVIDTNLNGVLRTCQSLYEPLKASGRGRIVNIASLGSYLALREVAAYAASKAGILSLTRSLGAEWARDGIRVNAIAPGVFPTDLNRRLLEGTDRGRELLMRTPVGRFGRPEELVGAAVLLSSDAASYISGESIAVDGGFLASGVNC